MSPPAISFSPSLQLAAVRFTGVLDGDAEQPDPASDRPAPSTVAAG